MLTTGSALWLAGSVIEWESRSGHVEVRWEDRIAVLVLSRPDRLNALDLPMLDDVLDALRVLGSGPADGIVVTGAGRAFSAGDDLKETATMGRDDFDRLLGRFQDLTRAVLATQVPVVAALNGIAVGGAAELTLACDARFGHAGSDYLFPESSVGLVISNASSYLLPRLLGSRALPLVLDGTRISGERARELGLIDFYEESGTDVVPAAVAKLQDWQERGLATAAHLRLLRPRSEDIEAAMAREDEIGATAWDAGSGTEGTRRFVERRGSATSGG